MNPKGPAKPASFLKKNDLHNAMEYFIHRTFVEVSEQVQ